MRKTYQKTDPMNMVCKLILNSLYGKFGQSIVHDSLVIHTVNNSEDEIRLENWITEQGGAIKDIVTLDKNVLAIITGRKQNTQDTEDDEDNYQGANTNVAIASTVTSMARVFMSFFKNNPLWDLIYSDTDSIIIDRELPKELVGGELGDMKLEMKLTGFIGLAPKVYFLVTDKGEEIRKIKGVTASKAEGVTWDEFEGLLKKDSFLEFNQEKWFKNLLEGAITVKDVAYNLKVTSNKRMAIYEDGLFVATKPFRYDDLLKTKKSSAQQPLLSASPSQLLIAAPTQLLIAPPLIKEESKGFILIDNVISLPSPSRDIILSSSSSSSIVRRGYGR